jgi:oligopeptide/dipeptide ABC transporter ATP-binding protein
VDKNDSLIQVKELQKHFNLSHNLFQRYNTKSNILKAVDGISFNIKCGHSLGLAGESGCGKTTTGKMLLKLCEPTGGQYFFNNLNVSTIHKKEDMKEFRKKAQLMFQNPFEAINPRFTVKRALMEPLIIHHSGSKKEKEELVTYILNKVHLKPAKNYLEKHSHQLSGGQLQRIVLARALITNPTFLVADEPVSMLDVSIRASILNLMKGISEEMNLTTLYISHDLSLIHYMCDEIAIMYLGKIIETGLTEKVMGNPKHPYTQALIKAVPIPDPDIKNEEVKIKNFVPSPIDLPPGCIFQNRCPIATEICFKIKPELKNICQDHQVACHHVK